MSSFVCPECGAYCWDTNRGTITGCEHYPAEADPEPFEASAIEEAALGPWKVVEVGVTHDEWQI